MKQMSIVSFAYEVIRMQKEIEALQSRVVELEGYEEKYRELLHSGIAHSAKMQGCMMSVLTTPGVVDAFITHHTFVEQEVS